MLATDGATRTEPPGPATTVPGKRRRRWKLALLGALFASAVVLLVQCYHVLFGMNFHTVIPGRVYRCAQPTERTLEVMVAQHGIRTVINLRGSCEPFPWYLEEARTTHRHNVAQEDLWLSAGRLPSSSEIQRLVEVLDHCEYPVLLHCRRGADRTGLAAAIVLMLQPGVTYEQARRQLGLRYGHLALGRPANLDDFFTLYEGYLEREQKPHTPESFRHWVRHRYTAGGCRGEITLLDKAPLTAKCGQPLGVRVRARNLGERTWHFKPGVNAGIHLGFFLWDDYDRQLHVDKGGFLEAEVPPGGTIEVTLVLPALDRPGRYRVMIDLSDEQHCWFYQTGSEPLEEELIVRE